MALPAYAVDQDAVLKNVSDDVKWRNGLPNYNKAHALFDKYKTTNHKAGSLEEIVQNLVKNWEKEVSHKTDPHQWDTVDLDNYRFSCNGENKHTGMEMLKKGTYNALIGNTMYYNSAAITFEDSHDTFRKTLGEGFAWEVLEVFSGPPNVTFSWRHFGKMTNEFACTGLAGIPYKVAPTNKMIELFGMCKATVNDQLKLQDLQVFYDPNQMFVQMLESCPHAPFTFDQPKPSSSLPPLSKLSLADKQSEPAQPSQLHKSHKRSKEHRSHKRSERHEESSSLPPLEVPQSDKPAEAAQPTQPHESHQRSKEHRSHKRSERHEESSSLPPLEIPQSDKPSEPAQLSQRHQKHHRSKEHRSHKRSKEHRSHKRSERHKESSSLPPLEISQSNKPSQPAQLHHPDPPIQSSQGWPPGATVYLFTPTQSSQGWPPTATVYEYTPLQSQQAWQPSQPPLSSQSIQPPSEPAKYHHRHHHHHHHHHHHASSDKDPSRSQHR